MDNNGALLEVVDLHTHFFIKEGVVKAVNGVTFQLSPGKILGLVGESGCGKTVTALSLLRLVPYPGKVVAGQVNLRGRDLVEMEEAELRRIRGREVAMVFQDPMTSLNPMLTIGAQVQEVFTTHLSVSKEKARRQTEELLLGMGFPDPEKMVSRYPFQISGGMGQRVMMAMALALDPAVLIADEPTSNLDVTLQAEILDALKQRKETRGTAILLITHDWGVIAQMAQEVAVMYAGSIVEYSDVLNIFKHTRHPYTWSLLQTLTRLDDPRRPLHPIAGSPPSLLNLPDRCPFLRRCPKARLQCRQLPKPPLEALLPGHWVACYNPVDHDT